MSQDLRVSDYVLRFDLPFPGRSFIMHGYTGAVDIMSVDLANRLTTKDDDSYDLDRDVRQTLVDRGYLVRTSPEEERDHVDKLFGVFERRLKGNVALSLRLTGSSANLKAGLLAEPEKLFNGLNALRQFYVGSALGIDIAGVTGELDFLKNLLDLAKQWSYAPFVSLRGSQVAGLFEHLGDMPSPFLRIITAEPLFDELPVQLGRLVEEKIRFDWLISLDAQNAAGAERLAAWAQELKKASAEKKTVLNILLVSEQGQALPANLLDTNDKVAAMSANEVALFHHLCRFIETPGLVNLRPYFAKPDPTYVVDSEGLIYTLKRGEMFGDSTTAIGRLHEGRLELFEGHNLGSNGMAPAEIERLSECEECPYALVCGVHCGKNQNDSGATCRATFQEKVKRIAPMIIFNKIQVS